jgi:ABC-type Zn uptake system ZnuABC Zn-binding protein ZnuA
MGRWLRPDIRSIALLVVTVATLLVACGAGATATPDIAGPSPEPDALRVVATTTVFADLVRQVGGTKVSVSSLVPKGGEVHTFDPTPSDVAAVAEAQLIVANGLGLDDWLTTLASDAGAADTPLVELAVDLPDVHYLGAAEHDGQGVNPHLWLNVAYARKYVTKLTTALKAADPADAAAYDAGAATYDRRLADLDAWAKDQIAAIPAEARRIVSFHEAFPYLADAYGLEIVGVAVEAPGQEPSAGEIAALVDAIRAASVKAIFSEAQFPPDLVEQIAAETGATVESDLYNDSLGDPPVDTYEGLIRWDIERIVVALT